MDLIPEGAVLFAGVSGGADSVALLHILVRLGFHVTALHLHHGIRGTAADEDQRFVERLCAQLQIPLRTARTDVPALAAQQGLSTEMAARLARHTFFREVAAEANTAGAPLRFALGHHADDQLETFFLRAARGAGCGGLGGMRPYRKLAFTESADRPPGELHLIRPLLGIRCEALRAWLHQEQIEWREDATNRDETIPRNKVRHHLLPAFEQIHPGAADNLLRTMELLRNEDDYLSDAAPVDISLLPGLHPVQQRRTLRRWLLQQGAAADSQTIESVLRFASENNGSRTMDIEGLRLINEYGALRIEDGKASEPWSAWMTEGVGILHGPRCAAVSLDKVAGRTVIVRQPRPGDRMRPLDLAGSRKLQDLFTDMKIPRAQRAAWPVFECGGEIIWIPGGRIAQGWEVPVGAESALHLFAERSPGQEEN